MTCSVLTAPQSALHTGRDPSVLASIAQPGAELAIWRRAPAATWGAWLEQLPTHTLPTCRLELKANQAIPALGAIFAASGIPDTPPRRDFVSDVAAQLFRFAELSSTDTVRLRLDVVADNACHRWHRDCVPLRLICTYRGPGTCWLPPGLDHDGLEIADEFDPSEFQTMQAADVALFKGCGWPGQIHKGGIVHRSPRIEGTGIVRLVLVLDLPDKFKLSHGTAR